MTKIYALQYGEYSDYTVLGIFSTREFADMFWQNLPTSFVNCWVDEWTLDPAIEKIAAGLKMFRVPFDEDGKINGAVEEFYQFDEEKIEWMFGTIFLVWARDEQHAIKIAAERWTKLKAQS